MRLFKKLFGQKGEEPVVAAVEQQFDAEWDQAVTRFCIVTGRNGINISLKHPQTHQIMLPHEGINATFSEWRQIRAPYDRRRLLFDLLYDMVGKSLNVWQTANYLVADRRPDQALSLLEQSELPTTAQPDYAEHCAAFAQANLNMTQYANALSWSQKAVNASPDNGHFQTIQADALHLSDNCEKAHEIYSMLMASALPSQSNSSGVIAEMFRNLFARDTGVVSSPVLALEIGESLSNPAQCEEFWHLGETEFYYSPYFRMHHAYYLAQVGATDQSFAKLIALVQEMPWLQEASLNLLQYFEQFDPTGKQIMPEFQMQLRQTIQQNGWVIDGAI